MVVETDGPELWIGRCDDIVADGVILKDADVHREGETERPLAEWLERAKSYGVFPHHRQHLVAAPRVRKVRRLAEI